MAKSKAAFIAQRERLSLQKLSLLGLDFA